MTSLQAPGFTADYVQQQLLIPNNKDLEYHLQHNNIVSDMILLLADTPGIQTYSCENHNVTDDISRMKQNTIARAIHFHQAGKTDKARSLYRKILKKDPDNVDALHFYGVLNFQEGRTRKAIEMIERAIEVNPSYPDAHNNLGNIYLKLDRLDEARQCYEKTLQLAPDRVETHNNLGVLLRHLGENQSSMDHLERALALKPDWADAHYNLANTFAICGNEKEAMNHYRRAIELDRKFSMALQRLGTYLYSLGRIEDAIKLYKDWLELDPDNPIVKHMLAACSGENTPQRASADYVKETFDRFANSFDSKLERLDYKAPQLVAELVTSELTDNSPDLDILDAGCGTGLCAPLLRPLARQLSGVDLSQNMLNLAEERQCYDALVCEDLVVYVNGFNDTYDIVVSADTLVYFGDLNEVFNAVNKALKPGGLFAFSVEALDDGISSDGYRLQSHGRYAHERSYVERTANKAGLIPASIHEGVLRKELKEPVHGLIVLLKKPD